MKTLVATRIQELVEFDKSFGCPVIGSDEAGRGPIAGPVVAAAVFFPDFNDEVIEAIRFIDDSKKLSPKLRKEMSDVIKSLAVYGISEGSVEEIENYNILQASLLAMKRSCENVGANLCIRPLVLVDGKFTIPNYINTQKAVKKGDTLSASIAAASILAKVHRDELMEGLSLEFPVYGWHKNKGYPTAAHRLAVKQHGRCKWHRKNFCLK